jgi:uncharacterized protein (TIGR02996 family)
MTSEQAFLKEIFARPDDDAPRLVYADWLEERGDPRGEFIRVQIELARLDSGDPAGDDLRRRQRDLLRAHDQAWRAALPELPEDACWGEFRRGFVDEVRAAPGTGLLDRAEAIVAAVPLRRLALECWPAGASLAGSPLLARARELVLARSYHVTPSPPEDDALVAEVLTWPELRHLTHLALLGLSISAGSVEAVARVDLPRLASLHWERDLGRDLGLEPLPSAGWLRRLERLELEYCKLPGGLASRLCSNLAPGRLRRLALRGAALGDVDAADLAGSGLAAGLELLDLENNAVGPAGTAALVRALPDGARLVLDRNPVGDEGLRALAGSPLMGRLGELRCGRGELGDEGATAVAGSPFAGRLSLLYLPGQRVTSAGARALLASPRLPRLRVVNLDGNRIEVLPACRRAELEVLSLARNRLADSSLGAFAAGSHLPALARLSLEDNRLGAGAARALAGAAGLPSLKYLCLSANPLGNAGAAALFAGPGMPALEHLSLCDCGLGDEGARSLLRSPRLARLRRLDLHSRGNPLSETTYEDFCAEARRHGCVVDFRPAGTEADNE